MLYLIGFSKLHTADQFVFENRRSQTSYGILLFIGCWVMTTKTLFWNASLSALSNRQMPIIFVRLIVEDLYNCVS